jgi:transcriptional regulator with XRE-family HTH domain
MGLVDQVLAAQLPAPAMRKSIRKAAGVSLADMAQEFGVTPVTVLRWERGTSVPRRPQAIAYRQLLEQLRQAAS